MKSPPTEDPLVANGLGSPTCARGAQAGLPPAIQADCRTSGFIAAAAPTQNYGFDINIDSGFLGINFEKSVLDAVVSPAWMALVWITHGLIVALEWCFTLDLLRSPAMAGVAAGLREIQAAFTQPWLAVVLAVAAVAVAYHGLIRRRVAQTVGEAVLMLAMMAGGLWMVADPLASVGLLGSWVNESSLGALDVADRASTSQSSAAFAEAMHQLFSTAVGRPWCYMEFGDVGWCEDRGRLDPRLRAAALRLTGAGRPSGKCIALTDGACGLGPSASTHLREFELVRSAQTNGALFLALPPNGVNRNSVSTEGAMLNVLCEGKEATKCHGPTAAQAEFRTAQGLVPRFEGLVLIAVGATGLLLLLGFVTLRLLGAAIVALLYLLVAPIVLLAPALGAGGRDVFRRWATRLLGAIVAKLVYSLLLGVVLMLGRALTELSLGWWVQWLLVSTLWWGAWRHRERLVSFGLPAHAAPHQSAPARLAASVVPQPDQLFHRLSDMWDTVSRPRPELPPPKPKEPPPKPKEPPPKPKEPTPKPTKQPPDGGQDGPDDRPAPPAPSPPSTSSPSTPPSGEAAPGGPEPIPPQPPPREPPPREPALPESAPREPAPREPGPREPGPREPGPHEPVPREPGPREPAPRESGP
ncbi:MAG: hypothetical protein FWD42_08050, partial [Solirubrobacterales bacterium]|nr:hypothetical protein [Solirubrobacterales bacterium]